MTVGIDCEFTVITPIVSSIVGGTVLFSADTTFPVKEGVVATVPGGGAPIVPPAEAKFFGTPLSGWGPLDRHIHRQVHRWPDELDVGLQRRRRHG